LTQIPTPSPTVSSNIPRNINALKNSKASQIGAGGDGTQTGTTGSAGKLIGAKQTTSSSNQQQNQTDTSLTNSKNRRFGRQQSGDGLPSSSATVPGGGGGGNKTSTATSTLKVGQAQTTSNSQTLTGGNTRNRTVPQITGQGSQSLQTTGGTKRGADTKKPKTTPTPSPTPVKH
jgi:hypothetical protein